jgi:O-acetyl-ADP-ribose deacetylase (regulator of RNase III)
MTEIQYVTGDATAPTIPGPRIIAHICNDVGSWGKGFVLALSRRWPAPAAEYKKWYANRDRNDFRLGAVQLVEVAPDLWVANMVAQHRLTAQSGVPPIRYDALEESLKQVAERAAQLGASVHMPRIGCGLAGGRWEEVEPIIRRTLAERDVPVTVYDLA